MFFNLALRERYIQVRLYLKVVLKSWDVDILIIITNFQKSSLGWPQQPHFTKKILSFMFPSTMAPKWPILVSQCGIDHQKPTILLIFGTLSLGGCGGHPMRLKLNLKDKSQMSTSNECTGNFKSNLICLFPFVRAKL